MRHDVSIFPGLGFSLPGPPGGESLSQACLSPRAAPLSSAQRDGGDRRLGVSSGVVWVHLKHTHLLLFFKEAYGSLMENVKSAKR